MPKHVYVAMPKCTDVFHSRFKCQSRSNRVFVFVLFTEEIHHWIGKGPKHTLCHPLTFWAHFFQVWRSSQSILYYKLLENKIKFHKQVCWISYTKAIFWKLKRHKKICCIGNPNGEHMLGCIFYVHDFILFWKKNKISSFGGISKFVKLIVFGQILTKFASFEQFWIILSRFSCCGMVDSMPSFEMKRK
jgi:hypothetical protein